MKENWKRFIVINDKHIAELNAGMGMPKGQDCSAVKQLYDGLNNFRAMYERVCMRKLDNEYIVCNRDEPYADEVMGTILSGESEKEAQG